MLAVANRRKAGCGRMTRRWSSRVRRPETSSTRWMTNITSGRPASYSSKQSAMLFCSAHGSMPSRNSVICLPSLQHDRVLADEIDARDVAVEIDAHQRPVEPRGDLLDVGRLAGAVIAGDHDAAVEGEAGENGERRVAVEQIVGIDIRHMFVRLRVGRRLHVRIDAERLAHGNARVGKTGGGVRPQSASVSNSWVLRASRPRGKERLSLTRIPVRGKSRQPVNVQRRRNGLRFRPACWRGDNYRPG